MATDLFKRIVRESGLSTIIAEPTLRRSIQGLGLNTDELTPQDLKRALPAIENCLRVFLPADAMQARMKKIASLL